MDQDRPLDGFSNGYAAEPITNATSGFSYDESYSTLSGITVRPIPNLQPYHVVSEENNFKSNLQRRRKIKKSGKNKPQSYASPIYFYFLPLFPSS